MIIEGLAPYGGKNSSSCGGLVAFGHQMGGTYKYNNQGQIRYGVVVVVVVV